MAYTLIVTATVSVTVSVTVDCNCRVLRRCRYLCCCATLTIRSLFSSVNQLYSCIIIILLLYLFFTHCSWTAVIIAWMKAVELAGILGSH